MGKENIDDYMDEVHELDLTQLLKINNKEVEPLNSKTIIVMFYAPWCGHCNAMKPELENVAKKTNKDTCVCKMNCDDNAEAPKKYGISGFPTTIVFEDGKEKKRMEGRMDADTVIKKLHTQTGGGKQIFYFYPH